MTAVIPSLCLAALVAAISVTASSGSPQAAPFAPINPAGVAPGRTIDRAALQERLAVAMQQARDNGFSGVALVQLEGETVFEAVAGERDRSRGLPVRRDTRFSLASTGKMFTTVAVLQLVEQGRLDLDAPIGRYLPDWSQASVREQVTARHLLTHTSGLGSFFASPDFGQMRTRLHEVSDYLPLLAADQPAFVPGSDYAYSNNGFILLGRLVEVASKQDYYAYVAEHVFAPAGMRDSGYYDRTGRAPGVAIGYVPGAGGVFTNDAQREWRGGPAGGGYSTAPDLLRFHQALVGGKLLRPATVDILLTPLSLPGEGARRSAGLGLIVARSGDDFSYGHPGGAPGMAAEFWAMRRGSATMVVLANVAPVPRSGFPAPAVALSAAITDALVAAGGPRLGSGARRRG